MQRVEKCPACGNAELKPFGMTSSAKKYLHFSQARCARCALLISQPQASNAEMAEYYGSIYYQDIWNEPEMVWQLNSRAYEQYEWPIMQNLWAEFAPPPGGRIAEVGCGYGVMLGFLRRRGFQTQGCELSQKAVDFCRAKGLDVVLGQSPGIQLERGRFDAAMSLQVIEHVANPLLLVSEMMELVRPGGAIVIVTEDAFNAQHYWNRARAIMTGNIPPFRSSTDHTFVFNSDNLTRLMSTAGCRHVIARSFTYQPAKERPHWRAYKGAMRLIDRITRHGEFLMAVGMKNK